jgi:hypothetical protein
MDPLPISSNFKEQWKIAENLVLDIEKFKNDTKNAVD